MTARPFATSEILETIVELKLIMRGVLCSVRRQRGLARYRTVSRFMAAVRRRRAHRVSRSANAHNSARCSEPIACASSANIPAPRYRATPMRRPLQHDAAAWQHGCIQCSWAIRRAWLVRARHAGTPAGPVAQSVTARPNHAPPPRALIVRGHEAEARRRTGDPSRVEVGNPGACSHAVSRARAGSALCGRRAPAARGDRSLMERVALIRKRQRRTTLDRTMTIRRLRPNKSRSVQNRIAPMDDLFTHSQRPAPAASAIDDEFWSVRTIAAKTGLARSTIYLYVKQGLFPRQRRMGPSRVAWLASDVRNWMSAVDCLAA